MQVNIPTKEELNDFLDRAINDILPSKEDFAKALTSGKRLKIYAGIDPTAPTLHIGHMIGLLKLCTLQKWGHEIILLVGDFTGMIGDPTGKETVRKKLTKEEVLENAKLYKKQASTFLNFDDKKNPAQLKYNSQWLSGLTFSDVIELASEFTVSQMLERDMFQDRIKENKPIFLHEFLYPLMQGYDSVVMDVDVEIGGNDQLFNMLAGRDMLKRRGKEKFVLTLQLLVDQSGKKMGKTEGNMISLLDSENEMFGKVMSWTDDMIFKGFRLCTKIESAKIDEMEREFLSKKSHPMDLKKYLAKSIVALYHGKEAGNMAQQEFEKIFQKKERPTEIQEFIIDESPKNIIDLLILTKLAKNKSEAKRFIDQKGVKVNDMVIEDAKIDIAVDKDPVLIQRGKRFFVKVKMK
ncbi:MAG: tyrosine--tRNA ligase [Nanoarchaeota archaeon]|nr:tyrosine--tRNA ligase [Nanoarchaeota archaeon]